MKIYKIREKAEFPGAAFGLACIFLTQNLLEAVAAGSLLLFIYCVSFLFRELFSHNLPLWSVRGCNALLCGSLYCFFMKIAGVFLGLEPHALIVYWVIGALTETGEENGKYSIWNGIYEGAIFWGGMVVIGGVREFLASGYLAGFYLVSWEILTQSMTGLFAGCLLTGIWMGIFNGILHKKMQDREELPRFGIILIGISALESLSLGKCLAFSLLFAGAWQRLKFSQIPPSVQGIPAESLCTGILAMLLTHF